MNKIILKSQRQFCSNVNDLIEKLNLGQNVDVLFVITLFARSLTKRKPMIISTKKDAPFHLKYVSFL